MRERGEKDNSKGKERQTREKMHTEESVEIGQREREQEIGRDERRHEKRKMQWEEGKS